MSETSKGLENLIVWRKSLNLVKLVYQTILPFLPIEEKWGLSSQIRRSSNSIHANIAEGYGRYYYQDNVRFCYIARGSLEETYSHVRACVELGYIANEQATPVFISILELKKILSGYIQFIKQSKQGEKDGVLDHGGSINESPSLYEIHGSDFAFSMSTEEIN